MKGLNTEQLSQLGQSSQRESYENQAVIVREGEEARDFFLLEKGKVTIRKSNFIIGEKEEGDYFGLMPMFDQSSRSADVVAVGEVHLLRIPYSQLTQKGNRKLYNALLESHIISQQAELRRMNFSAISEMKAKLEEAKSRIFTFQFFVSLVFLLVVYEFFLGILLNWRSMLHQDNFINIFTPVAMVIMGFAAFWFIKKSGWPYSDFGLTTKNWRKDLGPTLLLSGLFLAAAAALQWLLFTYVPAFQGRPFLKVNEFFVNNLPLGITLIIFYIILAPVQELIIRGVLQSVLQRLFEGRYAGIKAILLTNLLFSGFHLHFNPLFAVVTFIPGLLWGYLFYKQGSLVGVSVSHIIIGLLGILFLGL
ncbi:MAG: cyclic nucleotide-binding domain-containing protein [Lewinellaceae bacterium]|nr:cyclic nucleotide-binding domain-containing protein [Lewinellaceae bacterium]